MSKVEQKDRKDLEAAINSLYDLFPDPDTKYGCSNLKTKELVKLRKAVTNIEDGLKEQLKMNLKLVKAKKELNEKTCETVNEAHRLHRKVDELRRRLNVRGVTEQLRDEIEELAATKPIITGECMCDDSDEG